ncbi:hypothetical protein VQ056_23450 [Paenibacillus sp. JTLBN-2024]
MAWNGVSAMNFTVKGAGGCTASNIPADRRKKRQKETACVAKRRLQSGPAACFPENASLRQDSSRPFVRGSAIFTLDCTAKASPLFFTLLLDASALLYFSSIGMQINVPLLILLALVIPVTYFYNVYDVLQSADYVIYYRVGTHGQEERQVSPYRNPFAVERSALFGIMLVAGGALMFLFLSKAAVAPVLHGGLRQNHGGGGADHRRLVGRRPGNLAFAGNNAAQKAGRGKRAAFRRQRTGKKT